MFWPTQYKYANLQYLETLENNSLKWRIRHPVMLFWYYLYFTSNLLHSRMYGFTAVQFSRSVMSNSLRLCDTVNCSMPVLPVHHQLLESTQTHGHWVADAIQPSHQLLSPSPPALNLSQHQGLFKWVSSSHEVAKLLEFLLQHQSF